MYIYSKKKNVGWQLNCKLSYERLENSLIPKIVKHDISYVTKLSDMSVR